MYNPTKPSTDSVLALIKSTWNTPYLSVTPNTYAVFRKKFKYAEVDHTDGVGTKGIYHWKKKTFKNAALDSLAMNLNDLLLVRAQAYKLQNHLVLPTDNPQVIQEIMRTLVAECRKRDIAITGGETSIHNIPDSFDIGITISGFVKEEVPNKAKTGDVVVGIKSSGLHSNGFTLVRQLYKNKFRDDFIKPTRIYYDEILNLYETIKIHGMMHITGGSFSKLKGVIDQNQNILIASNQKLKPQQIFYDIYNFGVPAKKMYTTFNCGTGFIITLSAKEANKILPLIQNSAIIGEVTTGTGNVIINSEFDQKKITL